MSLYDKMAAAAILSGQYDDGLTTFHNVEVSASPNHIQHAGGIGRTGVQFNAWASDLGVSVKSVHINFRKYGLPTGNITINIRKGSDDTVAATIGAFPIESFHANIEQQLTLRIRLGGNTYNMVSGDRVSIEYPRNAVNGFEIATNSVLSDPTSYTSQSHNGTSWSITSDPLAIVIKS